MSDWRVIITDTYGPTGVAPVCKHQNDVTKHSTGDGYGKVVDTNGVYDCCPGPHIETWSEEAARIVADKLTLHSADLCG